MCLFCQNIETQKKLPRASLLAFYSSVPRGEIFCSAKMCEGSRRRDLRGARRLFARARRARPKLPSPKKKKRHLGRNPRSVAKQTNHPQFTKLFNIRSNRVCNALALLQCVASHPETRGLFLSAHVPLYLYPFLNTVSKNRPFEYLRLTSLGVVGALVKMDDSDVINFLLQTEIIPLCLRIMETGSELSKTVATFIVQKILLDDMGLNYICATAERFYAVSTVLSNMVLSLVEQPSIRLLSASFFHSIDSEFYVGI